MTMINGSCTMAMSSNTVTVTTTGQSSLQISMNNGLASGQVVHTGDTLYYYINVANTGNRNELNAQLTDVVPQQCTFAAGASSSGWSCTSNSADSPCTLTIGRLNVNAYANYTWACTLTTNLPVTLRRRLPASPRPSAVLRT
eukprot:TRINITY_DN12844_c0_g1_i1.p1 TRINITY_DN12844_c0_g1~~TRINITY_DN12844_c0_g1_i1.p1  ORF type:complete len:149 (-),score=21.32 TRINITY_DN12844_c0_g1_i1:700-1125(-)